MGFSGWVLWSWLCGFLMVMGSSYQLLQPYVGREALGKTLAQLCRMLQVC